MRVKGIFARYFQKKEVERLEVMLNRRRKHQRRKVNRAARDENRLAQDVDDADADLGRALLLTVALHDVLLDKGLLVPNDLGQAARDIDLLDGTADGKLDPAVLRPADDSPPNASDDPKDFLKRLERDG